MSDDRKQATGGDAGHLVDALPEPLVEIGPGGEVRRANAAFHALGGVAGDPEPLEAGALVERGECRYRVELLGEAEAGARLFRLLPDGAETSRSRALATYLAGLESGHPPLKAALDALWEGTRWRWTFVTRFNPRMLKQVQVLYCAEHGEAGEPFDYRVEGTPCERVFDGTEDACRVFSDLPEIFPHDPWIQRVRPQKYVGQVYSTRDGVPLGHLFAISDRQVHGVPEARSVVGLLSHLVSFQLRALSWSELVDRATRQAYRDPLTGVASRAAFEQAVDYFEGSPDLPERQVAVVWLDLDSLKQVNDERGHPEGDRLLATFAHHLSSEIRPEDSLFRVGGDEFVLIVESGFDAPALARRLDQVTRTLREHGFESFSVSWGHADLQEVDGKLSDAIRLADLRMYEMKRRSASDPPSETADRAGGADA